MMTYTPRSILCCYASKENPCEESQRRACTVNAEDEVLPRTWSIDTPQDHDRGREIGSRTQTLQGSTEVQHDFVRREPNNQAPDSKPCQSSDIYRITAKDVSSPAEYQKEAGEGQREGAGWPR